MHLRKSRSSLRHWRDPYARQLRQDRLPPRPPRLPLLHLIELLERRTLSQQRLGSTILNHVPSVHHRHGVEVDNGVQTMRNRDDGMRAEFRPDEALHQTVRLDVHAGRRFVQHQDAAFPQHGSRKAEELPLAVAEHLGRQCRVQSTCSLYEMVEIHLLQSIFDCTVGAQFKGIDIVPHGSCQEVSILRQGDEPRAGLLSRKGGNVDAVNQDFAAGEIEQAQECRYKSALSTSASTADAYPLAGSDGKGNAI